MRQSIPIGATSIASSTPFEGGSLLPLFFEELAPSPIGAASPGASEQAPPEKSGSKLPRSKKARRRGRVPRVRYSEPVPWAVAIGARVRSTEPGAPGVTVAGSMALRVPKAALPAPEGQTPKAASTNELKAEIGLR